MWFNSTPEFDTELRDRFESVWQHAAAGKLDGWAETPEGALALVIVLDQFPLNMYRGDALCFSTEAKSRDIATLAIERSYDAQLTEDQKAFLYMPFMHSENLQDQDKAVELFTAMELDENLKYVKHHRKIIRNYGRFPHRNAILGRTSTAEETAYLESENAFLG